MLDSNKISEIIKSTERMFETSENTFKNSLPNFSSEKSGYIIAGNWKMNMDKSSTEKFLKGLCELKISADSTVIVIPPYPYISAVSKSLRYSKVRYGAQNVATEQNGAYTGEVSAEMLADFGCGYAIVGHSERREYYRESDEIIAKKIDRCFACGLVPIVCVGEKLDARQSMRYESVIEQQIIQGLSNLSESDAKNIIIAYEPVWAIGTGVVATPIQIEQTHKFIRDVLKRKFGMSGENIPILYGGSVKPDNIGEIAPILNVSGFLVGGASLKLSDFTSLIEKVGGLER